MSETPETSSAAQRISKALNIAPDVQYDGDHHKTWVVDQMVRALTGCPMVTKTGRSYLGALGDPPVEYAYEAQGESEEYLRFRAEHPEWDEGRAP